MYNVMQCIVARLYSSHSYPPPLDHMHASHETYLRDLGSFTDDVIETQECALGERVLSRCTPESWQICAVGTYPINLVSPLYDGPRSAGAVHLECCHQ
jgi:hypothetical protein